MDWQEMQRLHDDGMEETAWNLFAEMLRDEVYRGHRVPKQVEYLVHYTTLETLVSMLGINTSDGEAYVLAGSTPDADGARVSHWRGHLRLYDTFSANDPNEGRFFLQSADPHGSFRQHYQAVWQLFENQSARPAYQTSLMQANGVGQVDDLVFWRTYGHDGAGCALAFPKSTTLGGLDKLYGVRYGEEDASSCLASVKDALDAYSVVRGAPDFASGHVPGPIANVLSPLVYLYKSHHYEYEREARVVVPFSDLRENRVLLQKERARNGPWRHFAQIPELETNELLVSGSKILFGPSVDVSPNLRFVLTELLRRRNLYGPELRESEIAYRP